MTYFTDLSDQTKRLTGGSSGAPESIFLYKDRRVAGAAAATLVAGKLTSLAQYSGSLGAMTTPTTVANPDNTTPGSLRQTDPAGGLKKYLTAMAAVMGTGTGAAGSGGVLVLYDRLQHIGSMSGTVTTAQPVAGSLTRYTTGDGVEAFIEIYSAIGATPTTVTGSYTDQAGNTGHAFQSVAIGGAGLQEAQRIIPLQIASGDTGVRVVASVTLAGTTGTPGNFGVTLARRIAEIPLGSPEVGTDRSFSSGYPNYAEIIAGASLFLMFATSTQTLVPTIDAQFHFASAA